MNLFSRDKSRRKSKLELDAIKKALTAEMKKRRKKAVIGQRVPNVYEIILCPLDFDKYAVRKYFDALYLFVEQTVISMDIYLEGKLNINFRQDDNLSSGKCKISSHYADKKPTERAVSSDTLVIDRTALTLPIAISFEHNIARLTLKDKKNLAAWNLSDKRLFIGRRKNSDILLTDNTVSRLHASVSYENHRHLLQDADSLNGVFVNGEKISSHYLTVGDEILLGNTTLTYGLVSVYPDAENDDDEKKSERR